MPYDFGVEQFACKQLKTSFTLTLDLSALLYMFLRVKGKPLRIEHSGHHNGPNSGKKSLIGRILPGDVSCSLA